jgi:uncharacterized OsmC-like protein
MSGIAACGVSLVEMHAKEKKLPFGTLAVTVDAIRTEESWPDFEKIDVHFEFSGISSEQADYYVGVWKQNCPLYRAVAKSTPVNVDFEAVTSLAAVAS